MSNQPISGMLFRKQSQIDEVPFPLKGDERHTYLASRNATGRAVPSGLLIRALIAVLKGKVQAVKINTNHETLVTVESMSRPGTMNVCGSVGNTFFLPNGDPSRITYHVGVVAIADALGHPSQAVEFLQAYRQLLAESQRAGLQVSTKPALLRAADELYYWLRYAEQAVADCNDRLVGMTIDDVDNLTAPGGISQSVNVKALTDLAELDKLLPASPTPTAPAAPRRKRPVSRTLPAAPTTVESFQRSVSQAIGEAIELITREIDACLAVGLTPFLLGPTDVGKTTAVRQVALNHGWGFDEVSGLNSFADADLVGLRINGEEHPGIVARSFARARAGETVMTFFDELTRLNRRALDLLLRPLLPVSAEIARSMQLDTSVPIRMVEAPLWGVDYAPYDKVHIVLAANNWGSQIDPALCRRARPILVDFDPRVAQLFDSPLRDLITETWKAVAEGKAALPIGYQSLSMATGPADVTIINDYVNRLTVIDRPAALGFKKIAEGVGLKF